MAPRDLRPEMWRLIRQLGARGRIFDVSSTPMKSFFGHLPAWVPALASGIWRASANIIAIACSAVVMLLPKGVFITMTPFFDASGMSTLSTPMPARPTTLRFVAAARTSAVTFVAERIARPSYSPIIAISSSLLLPVMTSTSMPRSLKIAAAFGSILSLMRTLGAVMSLILFSREGGNPSPGVAVLQCQVMGPRLRGDTLKLVKRGVCPVEPRA